MLQYPIQEHIWAVWGKKKPFCLSHPVEVIPVDCEVISIDNMWIIRVQIGILCDAGYL